MACRWSKDARVEPLIAFPILLLAFVALSWFLFHKTGYAPYLYVFASLTFTTKLAETKRNEFLKICFHTSTYRKIRLIENFTAALPFCCFLLYMQLYVGLSVLLILSTLLAIVSFSTPLTAALPTPFYKKPFEFIVGFRNTFYLFPAAYILTGIAVWVDNFNLGLFSLLSVAVITMSYYTKPENEYYVWVYKHSAKQFLLQKIKIALVQASILVLPVVFILCIYFTPKIGQIFLFLLAAYGFLIAVIVAKYSAYPNEMGVLQGVLLVISLYFPPLLILLIPYFFGQAATRLNSLLP